MSKQNSAAGIAEEINKSLIINHARQIKKYCEENRKCEKCIFFSGVCSLAYSLPSDWGLDAWKEE